MLFVQFPNPAGTLGRLYFFQYLLVPRERPLPPEKSFKHEAKWDQHLVQNLLFRRSIFGSMLEGLQKRPGTTKILTKNHLRIFWGGSGPEKAIFSVPTWNPKCFKKHLFVGSQVRPAFGRPPEASGEPFWKHFGSILAPFFGIN